MSLFYWFDHFLYSGQKSVKFIGVFLENLRLSKRHSEINWPLEMWNFKLRKKSWYVHWQWTFHLWPLNLVKSNIPVLHSLSSKGWPKLNKIVDFWWSIPHWETRIGHFGARVDGNIKLSICFCEMRLSRSLRPLRLLRLLRSLRLQRFLGLENCYWGL